MDTQEEIPIGNEIYMMDVIGLKNGNIYYTEEAYSTYVQVYSIDDGARDGFNLEGISGESSGIEMTDSYFCVCWIEWQADDSWLCYYNFYDLDGNFIRTVGNENFDENALLLVIDGVMIVYSNNIIGIYDPASDKMEEEISVADVSISSFYGFDDEYFYVYDEEGNAGIIDRANGGWSRIY